MRNEKVKFTMTYGLVNIKIDIVKLLKRIIRSFKLQSSAFVTIKVNTANMDPLLCLQR